MLIMECRYTFLQKLIAALDKVCVPLVGFDGTKLVPFLNFDDVGIYIFIPKIVKFFQISLDQAIDLFFYSQLSITFCLGLLGFLLLFRTLPSIVFSFLSFALFLRFSYYSVFDVYVEYLVSTMSIIPLFLYFMLKNPESKLFNYFMVFAGIIICFTHYVRSYASLPVIGFIICMVLLNQKLMSIKKLMVLLCMMLGICISMVYFKTTIREYQQYANNNFPEFDHLQTKHVFWHQVYLGFGLLKILNKDDITWDDSFGEKKVKERNPTISLVQTAEYEAILKQEVFDLIKNQRGFVLWTLFAKIGILLLYFLVFANVGLFAFFCFMRRWDLDIAFLCSFALSSITPLLTLPYYSYALSFMAFAFIFGFYYSSAYLDLLWANMLKKSKKYYEVA